MTPREMIQGMAEVIARQIECEKDCMSRPSGCGCSESAAYAVLAYLAKLKVESVAVPNGNQGDAA